MMATDQKIGAVLCFGAAVGLGVWLVMVRMVDSRIQELNPNNPTEAAVQADLKKQAEDVYPWIGVGAGVASCAVFGLLCLIPRAWRGALRETNQLSRAVQGKLEEPPK